ncbi:Brix domain [Lasallia pustulata]|uniref:Ribosome production factor 2 homolog n=1 Tax=Lasallia pustulata TaxID=136370 RepID=A0A1W5DC99_9LECA|nr:Brix domain [Lasallia pustulata]
MLRQIQPKNARSKRALEKREPQTHENPKTTLFLKGSSTSDLLNHLLTDLHSLKRPLAIRFTKKNPIHPFEDASSLEFFSQKNDASLLVFGSHSKKRPHALTWVRCFGGKVLDMLELLVVPDTARTLAQFKGEKCKVGVKPMLSFSGTLFESPTTNAYTVAKSMFVDFFKGAEAGSVDVEGLQCLVTFAVGEEDEAAGAGGAEGQKPQIHMRVWRIVTKRSGQRLPRVEVEEMGPRIDFRVGRVREADEGMMKEALKKAKGTEARPKKNVETDIVGDKIGRIHLGRQDLGDLQTRKMKGLKRGRDADVEDEEDPEADDLTMVSDEEDDEEEVLDDGDSDDEADPKRQKLA